ncbi:MAG TPA: [FeFe] hydrogenase H-cluster radical SAM maturase HydE [Thermodesulfobacteriota bacterium]|nr:[FeFe] hydrogenase H-cluster radical SAM maturase HydE [Thermodesulfobacteriota bacterium]
MVQKTFFEVLRYAEEGRKLSFDDFLLLLSASRKEELEALFASADRVRQRFVGDEIHLRGIVEFSNICIQNCLYCGLRRDNHQLFRYRMSPREIVESAQMAKSRGLKTLVLQSGEDPWFTREKIAALIRDIKKSTGLAITLSVGERPDEDYEDWKSEGADRYLLKQETASPALFQRLRPGRKLDDRLGSLRVLKRLGYEVGSGNMVGLPGQEAKDLAQDIQLFLEYDFDMIGIGPFIPHPHTPLAESSRGDLWTALKVLAITRIVTRNTNLPATTAAVVLDPMGRRKALEAGANVIMPDITPWTYRRYYQIYPGKVHQGLEEDKVAELIFSLGRRISPGAGYRTSSTES